MIKKGNYYFPESVWGGSYVLIWGNTLDELEKRDSETVDLIVTSPPYLWQVDYELEGQYGWEDSSEEYIQNQKKVAEQLCRVLKPTGNMFWVIKDSMNGSGGAGGDNKRKDGSLRKKARRPNRDKDIPTRVPLRIPDRICEAFAEVGLWRKHRIIWNQKAAFRGGARRLPNSYEEIHHYVKDLDQYYFNNSVVLRDRADASARQLETDYEGKGEIDYAKLGREDPSDRKRRMIKKMKDRDGKCILLDIWDISTGRNPEVEMSDGSVVRGKASFPLNLAETCVLLGSRRGGIVLDPYSGMGTTLLAAVMHGRSAIGIDLNEKELRASAIRIERERDAAKSRGVRSGKKVKEVR